MSKVWSTYKCAIADIISRNIKVLDEQIQYVGLYLAIDNC
jgi:hypothetical protein